jgi:hypothetical protein
VAKTPSKSFSRIQVFDFYLFRRNVGQWDADTSLGLCYPLLLFEPRMGLAHPLQKVSHKR